MRSAKKAKSPITVGHRPLEDLHRRLALDPNGRGLASESRDWLLVRSLLQPGEVQWARCAVRFPHETNANGHTFLTDRRVMFEFHERVFSVNLSVITFIGVPQGPSVGDFAIEAMVPGASNYSTTMKIRDKDAFHDFFPTLHYAARAAGSQLAIDASWTGTYGDSTYGGGSYSTGSIPAQAPGTHALGYNPGPQTGSFDLPRQVSRTHMQVPPDAALAQALPAFLHEGESIHAAADMIQNMTDVAMKVMVTETRLIIAEGNVIWATPLDQTHVIYAGGERSHLRLLTEQVTDTMAIAPGPANANLSDQRRLVLRSTYDAAAAEHLHSYLTSNGGEVFDAWPEALG